MNPSQLSQTTWYSSFAKDTAHFCGRPRVFAIAVGVIAVWVLTGPLFHFSDTEAIQVKLDELIRATQGAHNALLDLEELEEDTLHAFRVKYQALATAARCGLGRGLEDTGTPEA